MYILRMKHSNLIRQVCKLHYAIHYTVCFCLAGGFTRWEGNSGETVIFQHKAMAGAVL